MQTSIKKELQLVHAKIAMLYSRLTLTDYLKPINVMSLDVFIFRGS